MSTIFESTIQSIIQMIGKENLTPEKCPNFLKFVINLPENVTVEEMSNTLENYICEAGTVNGVFIPNGGIVEEYRDKFRGNTEGIDWYNFSIHHNIPLEITGYTSDEIKRTLITKLKNTGWKE